MQFALLGYESGFVGAVIGLIRENILVTDFSSLDRLAFLLVEVQGELWSE